MPRFDPLAYRDPRPSSAIIEALGPINRFLILPGLLRVREVDFPASDVERMRQAVRPGAAAFVGPNHPEFMTDWMLDKEVSRRVSPLMAHWASYEIVNIHPLAQALWLRNNLIANAPGGGGREYSVRWAIAGHGVLLHPEGTPTWHGDEVGPLVPGIVQMAWETCRRLLAEERALPVHLVPLVWKLHFTRDIGRELEREMERIERGLALPTGRGLEVATRFAQLQRSILVRSREQFEGSSQDAFDDAGFFDAQAAHAVALLARLEERYGETPTADFARRAHALRRAILAGVASGTEGARADRRVLHELERLARLTRDLYGGPTLTQEQMAESLKQVRVTLLTRGWRNALHAVVPVAVAPRVAHVRAPEPIAVHEVFAPGSDEAAAQAALLGEFRARLQGGLDALNRALAPAIDPWRRANPLR
jgi:hypothetical protein